MAVLTVGVLLLTNYFLVIYASYHWKVTENGRITSQVENSGFPLAKEDDLLALLEQELRLQTISKLYKQMLFSKRSIEKQWNRIEREGDFEKKLYSSDIDCLIGEIPLSQHNLNTEFLDYGQGSRPKMKRSHKIVEPDCTMYSKLDFSMRTFPHLGTLNRRSDFNLSVSPVFSKKVIDFNIDAMLRLNSSDWTAYNVASLYWRTIGNGTNALECAKRALYFSPREQRYIVLLNLGTLLQELQSLGEAAIVLHSAVDHDPEQDVSHLALGNVYVALGDYKRSLACYENVLSLNPGNIRALQLKHALLCYKKLESGLLEIHSSLQKILKDLQKYSALHEEWLQLQNKVNWERKSEVKEFFSQPLYLNVQMMLQNVEHQAKNLKKEMSKRVTKKQNERAPLTNCRKGKPSVRCDREKSPRGPPSHDSGKNEGDETELENLTNSENALSNEINEVIAFIKTNYDDNIIVNEEELIISQEKIIINDDKVIINDEKMKLLDFKRKINEEFGILCKKTIGGPFIIGDFDACIKDSGDVKKLN